MKNPFRRRHKVGEWFIDPTTGNKFTIISISKSAIVLQLNNKTQYLAVNEKLLEACFRESPQSGV